MILSTNKKLISIGAEYSAGNGINITDHIISVVESAVGTNYSAGPNIDIYDVEGQPTISSKDWSNDIDQASAYAYEQAIAQIPAPQDLSYLSAKVDSNTSGIDYISSVCITAHQDWTDTIKGASSYSYEQSTSYFDNWVNGQYTGDVTNITNKISALSGNFEDYYKKTETSSKDEINDALQYVSANAGKVYEGISPIVVNNDENKVSAETWTFSAGSNVSFVDDNVNKITRIDCTITGEGGDPQVNALVRSNSGEWNKVSAKLDATAYTPFDPTYMSGAIDEKLNSTAFSTVSGDFLTAIPDSYATKDFVSNSISSKLDSSSFSTVSSTFLTNEDLNGYATESFVQDTSANITALIPTTTGFALKSDFTFKDYYYGSKLYLTGVSGYYISAAASDRSNFATKAQRDSDGDYIASKYYTNSAAGALASMLSGAIDYVSGQVDNKLDTTSFSDVSGSFLTAHQDLSDYQTTAGMVDYATTATTNTLSEQIEELSGTISAKHTLSAGEGISFFEDDVNNITRIDCTVTGGGLTGDYVSGSNTASITDIFTYDYSATISGDVTVDVEQKYRDSTYYTWHYSLFNVGSALDNKLDAEYISSSNTIKKLNDNDNHYEVVGKSYREANIKNISASEIDLFEGGARIGLNGGPGYYLKSAIITVESDTIGSFDNDLTLQSSAGGSAVLTKSYTNRTNHNNTYLWSDWNITNIDASATVFSGYELAELAFKDEIPSGGGVVTGDFVPLSSFNELSSNINSNSVVWNDVVNKLYISSYHELTAGTNIDIQDYVISSKDWTNEIAQASAYAYNESTALIPTLTFHYLEI